jgi:hypothetical protein
LLLESRDKTRHLLSIERQELPDGGAHWLIRDRSVREIDIADCFARAIDFGLNLLHRACFCPCGQVQVRRHPGSNMTLNALHLPSASLTLRSKGQLSGLSGACAMTAIGVRSYRNSLTGSEWASEEL